MTDPLSQAMAAAFDQVLNDRRAKRATPTDDVQAMRAARRQCDDEGHPSYRVTGKRSPTKIECPRCRCTWQVGPKSEPK